MPRPRLEITYCTQCRWLLRAGWTTQELLTTFPADLGEVALVPGTGGVFTVRLDDDVLWGAAVRRSPAARPAVDARAGEPGGCDSKEHGGFPELSRLKQMVRDRVAPDRSLGHSDKR